MIITFSGMDGTGKSTASRKLSDHLAGSGYRVRYEYIGEYFILKYIVSLLHMTYKKKGRQTQENPFLSGETKPWMKLWVFLTFIDGWMRYLRLRILSGLGYAVICDRFMTDKILGLEYFGYSARRISDFLLKFSPRPDIAYILDTDEKSAQIREVNHHHPLRFFVYMRKRYKDASGIVHAEIVSGNFDEDRFYLPEQKKNVTGKTILIFLLFACIAYLPMFNTRIMYTTWDYTFPLTRLQVENRIDTATSAINWRFATGTADIHETIMYYWWVFIWPFTLLFGYQAVKALLLFLTVVSGYGMYILLTRLKVSGLIALLLSIFYMFNPFFYSRILAGHFNAAALSAFLPFLIVFVVRLTDSSSWKYFPHTICFFILSSLHPMGIGISAIFLSALFLYRMIFSDIKKNIWIKSVVVLLFLTVINMHWIFPMGKNYLEGNAYLRGDIAASDEMTQRKQKVEGSGSPLWFSMSFYNRIGLDTEYVMPVQRPKIFIAVQILMIAGTLLFVVAARDTLGMFIGLFFLFSAAMTSGVGNPVGTFVYKELLSRVTPLYFEYSNSNRFLMLAVVSGTVLFAYGIDRILRKHIHFMLLVFLCCVLFVVVRVEPFMNGSLFVPKTLYPTLPLAIKFQPYTDEVREVLNRVNEQHDYRVGYLPPFQTSPVDTSVMNLGTQAIHGASGDYFNGYSMDIPFHRYMISLFSSDTPYTRLGTLLGLSNVGEFYFPRYPAYRFFLSFGQHKSSNTTETLYESDRVIESNLSLQTDIAVTEMQGIREYRNSKNLPRIYSFDRLYALTGGYDQLAMLVEKDQIDLKQESVIYMKTSTPEQIRQADGILESEFGKERLAMKLSAAARPDFLSNPKYNLRNFFQGELDISEIPGTDKGVRLNAGQYEVGASDDSVMVVDKGVSVDVVPAGMKLNIFDQTDISDAIVVSKSEWQKSLDEAAKLLAKTTSGKNIPGNGAISYKRISPATYRVYKTNSDRYLYLSETFSDRWYIEGYESVEPFQGGAEGVTFRIPSQISPTFYIKFRGQKDMDLGYTIQRIGWLVFVFTGVYIVKKYEA